MNRATRTSGAITAVCLLAAAACSSSDGDTTSEIAPTDTPTTVAAEAVAEPTTTEVRASTSTTAPPTTAPAVTAAPEATTTQPSDTVVVPFHIIDDGFPDGWTCDAAIPGFDVAFTVEGGERTNVEARFTTSSPLSTDNPNAACAIEEYEGAPALFLTAQLEAPAAEIYQLIETRYPYANGAGNDGYAPHFQMVTSEQAQAGLYVGDAALDPSEVADLPFPLVERPEV